ncbi:hypothetical protein KY334_02715 [Candidatus Woesearchaeota archaeon]|nr:hypothetical protein [Candidatus Woesearchaeota archaeon]
MKYLFWCEFPEKVDWERLNHIFEKNNFIAETGVVCRSKEDFLKYKDYSNIKIVRAWPVLSKEKGYWFSSHTKKEDIDSLDQYKGMKIKLDIEPPLPQGKYKLGMVFWLLKYCFIRGKNHKYLLNKIKKLSKDTDIMLSTFSFPDWIGRNMGMTYSKDLKYNFIHYSSFIPNFFLPIYNLYMKWLIKRKLKFKKEISFAVGLITPGIFGNEPCYSSPKELKKDLKFMKKLKVENVVIFRLGSFLEVKNPDKWIDVLKANLPS